MGGGRRKMKETRTDGQVVFNWRFFYPSNLSNALVPIFCACIVIVILLVLIVSHSKINSVVTPVHYNNYP